MAIQRGRQVGTNLQTFGTRTTVLFPGVHTWHVTCAERVVAEASRPVTFRSKMEANWARYLEWQRGHGDLANWLYEPCVFHFPYGSAYTPDFIVIWHRMTSDWIAVIHEVKGRLDQRSRGKLKRMRTYYPEIPIELIDRARYLTVARKMKHVIDGWLCG